jgi:site-specific DNA-methyltransferase (adenine-specific)
MAIEWTVIHGDSREWMDRLSFDAVITDPPYGVNWKGHTASTVKWEGFKNDDGLLDLRPMLRLLVPVVSFGANCYPDQLPHRGRWLVWDKRVNENADRMLGSPFEMAWTNRHKGYEKIYRIMHGGVVNADGHGIKRVHPTQKPVELMRRIIEDFTKPGDTVLDPFMGSGTTGVACVRAGRNFIGIEIDGGYAEIARKRIAEAVEGVLFP